MVFLAASAGKRKIKWRTGGKYQHVFSVPHRHPEIWDVITLIDEHKLTISFLRSCPELDKDIGAGLAERTPIQFGNQDFPNIMENNISRSAHSIKVSSSIFFKPTRLSPNSKTVKIHCFILLAVMKDVNQNLGLAPSGIH